MGLTNEDRALIAEKSPGDETTEGWEYALLHRTVEQIIARHVMTALEEAAKGIEEVFDPCCTCETCATSAVAARIVRNLANSPPPMNVATAAGAP